MVTVTDPQTGEQTEITRAKWLNEYFDTNQQRYMTVMSYSAHVSRRSREACAIRLPTTISL